MIDQIGGGNCSLCGSANTNKTTCPLNKGAKNPNPAKHPLASRLSLATKPASPKAHVQPREQYVRPVQPRVQSVRPVQPKVQPRVQSVRPVQPRVQSVRPVQPKVQAKEQFVRPQIRIQSVQSVQPIAEPIAEPVAEPVAEQLGAPLGDPSGASSGKQAVGQRSQSADSWIHVAQPRAQAVGQRAQAAHHSPWIQVPPAGQIHQVDQMQEESRMVGKGTYGCVYSPSVPCILTDGRLKKSNRELVSKLAKLKSAEEEMASFSTIDRIDPTQEYHIGKPVKCQPINHKYADNCTSIKEGDDYTSILYMNGGISLSKFLRDKFDAFQLLRSFSNILYGISQMNINGNYHMDIKEDNIVIKDYHMRLIDFGLAVSNQPDSYNLYNSSYFAWPPDLFLISSDPIPYQFIFSKHVQNCNHILTILDETRGKRLAGVTPLSEIDARAIYGKLAVIGGKDRRVRTILEKVDVFSIAGVLANILLKCRIQNPPIPRELDFELSDLVVRCTNYDPTIRLSAEDAYQQYMDILRKHKI